MRIIVSTLLLWYFGSVFPVWAEPEEIGANGCRECHRLSLKEKKSNKGPDLFYAGDKFYKNWLNKFLQSPAVIHEVIFPSRLGFLNGKSKENQPHITLTKDESERVVNFLMTLRLPDLVTGKVNEEYLSKGERARAKILFERSFGCISCHRTLNLVGKVRGGVSGPSLVNSGLRLKPELTKEGPDTPPRTLPTRFKVL
jgi:hypothetical protein